jgi:hypothetical protein
VRSVKSSKPRVMPATHCLRTRRLAKQQQTVPSSGSLHPD